jgi:hypothetical protein
MTHMLCDPRRRRPLARSRIGRHRRVPAFTVADAIAAMVADERAAAPATSLARHRPERRAARRPRPQE